MGRDGTSTAYQDGNVILEMEVHKQPNGMFKASALGREHSSFSSEIAVTTLQQELEQAFLSGELQPEM